jgi:Flp pilus assembly protein TadG
MSAAPVHASPHDEGTVTAFAVILTTALLACAGLVLDGGLALTARVRVVNLAQEAARAGAQELDLATYRTTGTVVLRPDAAATTARAYLAAAGVTGQVTTLGATVSVTVEADQPSQLLTLIGIRSLHVTGHASAVARDADPTAPLTAALP